MPIPELSLQQWSNIAEIVAGVGVALVAIQVWLGVRNSRVELITNMTTLITQVDQAFIEHPHLWRYFRAKTEPPPKGETDGDRARAIALTMANVLDHVVGHMGKMHWRTRGAWRLYIYDVHGTSPVLEEVLKENPAWWPGLQKQLDRGDPRSRCALARRFL